MEKVLETFKYYIVLHSNMESISLKLEGNFLRDIERIMRKHRYSTKTEFIREAIRDKINGIEKQETLKKIAEVVKEFGKKGPSYYNICMTDCQSIIATRYCTHEKKKNLTFHYLEGYVFAKEGKWIKEEGPPSFIIVSSEKFNDLAEGWEDIPPQHMMLVDENKMIQLRPL